MHSTMLTNIKAAIIDLDGTMLDTAPDIHAAINLMRADLQLPPQSLALISNFVGKGTENLMLRTLGADYSEAEVEQHYPAALASYMAHYPQINGKYATVFPGVVDGLIALKAKGLRLACVTNKPIAFALALLESVELRDYFDVVYGGDSLPHKKPHPVPLLQVCADFSLQPAQVVAIGDSSNDAKAARAAGCYALIVPYGYNHGESVQDVDSDGIVQTLHDAAALIR
jgi:phosphoglycolate phosphatase